MAAQEHGFVFPIGMEITLPLRLVVCTHDSLMTFTVITVRTPSLCMLGIAVNLPISLVELLLRRSPPSPTTTMPFFRVAPVGFDEFVFLREVRVIRSAIAIATSRLITLATESTRHLVLLVYGESAYNENK
jgi:hypothetical protein